MNMSGMAPWSLLVQLPVATQTTSCPRRRPKSSGFPEYDCRSIMRQAIRKPTAPRRGRPVGFDFTGL